MNRTGYSQSISKPKMTKKKVRKKKNVNYGSSKSSKKKPRKRKSLY